MDALNGKTVRFVLVADPEIWVGADNCDNCAVKPVITDGEMKNWHGEDGCLVLEDNWYCFAENGKVVLRNIPGECTKWEVVAESGGLRIRLAGTNSAWTAPADPKEPVTLTPIGSVDPKYQLFSLRMDDSE